MAHNQNEYLKKVYHCKALVIKPRQHYTPPSHSVLHINFHKINLSDNLSVTVNHLDIIKNKNIYKN